MPKNCDEPLGSAIGSDISEGGLDEDEKREDVFAKRPILDTVWTSERQSSLSTAIKSWSSKPGTSSQNESDIVTSPSSVISSCDSKSPTSDALRGPAARKRRNPTCPVNLSTRISARTLVERKQAEREQTLTEEEVKKYSEMGRNIFQSRKASTDETTKVTPSLGEGSTLGSAPSDDSSSSPAKTSAHYTLIRKALAELDEKIIYDGGAKSYWVW